MKASLIVMILAGTLVGFVMPREQAPALAPAKEKEPAAQPKRARQPAIAPPASSWGGELRLQPSPDGHFYATALVNGQPIQFVVDTGATTVALTVDDARRAGIVVDPSRFDIVGDGAGGPVRGHEIEIRTVSLDGREVRQLHGVVLEGADKSLLGQNYLSRLAEVRMTGGEMILR